MTPRGRLFTWTTICVAAFVAGFGLATLMTRTGASAGVRGQVGLYEQVLHDLQHNYYKRVDVARLGQTGIAGLLKSLHDPYTVYFTPKQARLFSQELQGTYTGIGAGLAKKDHRLTVTQVFHASPAAEAGMRPGDVIVTINGRPTTGEPVDVSAARIRGPAGSCVRLELSRPGRPGSLRLTITRGQIAAPLASSRLINDHGVKVGYVALSAFAQGAGGDVSRAVAHLQSRGARRLILDLRDNGGGLVTEAVNVAGDFLPSGSVVATTQGLHSPKDVLRTNGASPSALPLVVLVNGNTASASEIVTGALRDDHRATILGSRTFGKGVMQEVLPLPGGASLKITVASYLTPNGSDINHKGIAPTIVVSRSPHAGVDPALRRALRFIATGH